MKLDVIVLALLCVTAYVIAEKGKEKSRWPTTFSLPHRFRRDTEAQNSVIANVEHGEVPQLSIDANINKFLFDNGYTSIDLTENANVVSESEPRLNGKLNILHQIDENSFLHAYGNLNSDADGDITRNFGLNGALRFRREADPQRNSISFQGNQPLSGPNRQPTWDLNFNRNIANNDRTRTDVFGGVSKVPGQRAQPHIGIQTERNFGNNGFIRGSGQLQPGRGGHGVSPSVGITGGFRFRREADPQRNSISFQGNQPLSGPNRQPTWDLNFNRNIANNDRTRTDIFGGVSKVPGQRAQPHIGIQTERNFGNNGFIRGSGQLQPGRGGHGVSPSVGITGGFRFRREADPRKKKNSVSFQADQSGPNRQPSWDVNFNRNVANNDRTKVDVFGGVSKVPRQRAQPYFGVEAERNFGRNGFIRGSGQVQPGRGGHGVSPSFGITGGFRFRREAEPQFA